jgi:hypothetical protein
LNIEKEALRDAALRVMEEIAEDSGPESEIEIILEAPEPMDNQRPVTPPIRIPIKKSMRTTRPGQKRCRNTFLHKGCGQWKPEEDFLDGSKRCDECRLRDIKQREQDKWDSAIPCYVCGKSTMRASARTNGLRPKEYFCTEECSRVLNALNWHEKHKVSWQRAKERAYKKCRSALDRDDFLIKCDNVKNGHWKPGTYQEHVEFVNADKQFPSAEEVLDLDAPPFRPEYDSWWAEVVEATASEADPPILANTWRDPFKFNVDGDAEEVYHIEDLMRANVDLDF